jgi:hypothetical protein
MYLRNRHCLLYDNLSSERRRRILLVSSSVANSNRRTQRRNRRWLHANHTTYDSQPLYQGNANVWRSIVHLALVV